MRTSGFDFGPVSAEEVEEADAFFEELVGHAPTRARARARHARARAPADEQSTIATEITTFLRANAKSNVHSEGHSANVTHPLVVYCETHVGNVQKSAFFAELVRRAATATGSSRPRFHATERFDGTTAIRSELKKYIQSTGKKKKLSKNLRKYQEMLDAVSAVPGHGFAVLPSNDAAARGGNLRHRAIYDAFIASRNAHNTANPSNQLSDASHGHFFIGAFHGGRVNVDGTSSKKTTTQLLLSHITDIFVVRLYVDEEGEFREDGTIVAGESDDIFELGSTTSFELLPMLRAVNGSKSFIAPIAGKGSVFSRLRNDDRTTTPYDQVFDAILYLNEPLTPRYRVKRGDTLWGIARRKLGRGSRWREIYDGNRGVIGADPDRIYPEQLLVLPKK